MLLNGKSSDKLILGFSVLLGIFSAKIIFFRKKHEKMTKKERFLRYSVSRDNPSRDNPPINPRRNNSLNLRDNTGLLPNLWEIYADRNP